MGGKSIVKLFLTFCKSHRGFTRARIPRKDPQEREEREKIVFGEGKKGEILGGLAEGGRLLSRRARSTSANFDFGQLFFSSSANFDFGQIRFRPIFGC